MWNTLAEENVILLLAFDDAISLSFLLDSTKD